jgi:hypothetical protein
MEEEGGSQPASNQDKQKESCNQSEDRMTNVQCFSVTTGHRRGECPSVTQRWCLKEAKTNTVLNGFTQ